MTSISEKVIDKTGLKLHIVTTDKYKTNTLVWKMKAPLEKDTVTLRGLLPHVLQSNTKNYPTNTKLRTYLDDLYGASLYVDLAKKGEFHIMSFTIEIANEKFLSDQTSLLEKAFQILTEVLLQPNVTNNAFDSTTVDKEKRTLKQRIQSLYDDKMKYSSVRLIEEMCKGEPYELEANGIKDDVDSITPQSLYQYYEQALKTDEIDLYIIGDVKEQEVTALADRYIKLSERPGGEKAHHERKQIKDVKEIKENQDVKQGKLNIGYRTNIYYGDDKYYPLQVFNGIFGGFSHSKLFINVREKASLAYYAASRLESHKGLLLVMSGIDNNNYDQAVSIIHEQMDAMKKGDFSEDELAQTKAVIKNQLLETIDVARGLVEVLYHNVIIGKDISLKDWMEKTDKVTHEEIVDVAQSIELDTIYFLTGTKGE
ncbi:EF-P 5-aminopentanol modification-associated protein YfmF [Peribacillus alkalitolerans]|uniref:EF-P 5-aminopentanol modification-associated protein YfmF n=1 Tax=Peribacillus alkalitolerans TaxID=1550385 RepID=UPI0013D04C7F|nr:pitrilysin family protein [Peribacillus alkalitolerans]